MRLAYRALIHHNPGQPCSKDLTCQSRSSSPACRAEYGLRAARLTFLPLGADFNTAVFPWMPWMRRLTSSSCAAAPLTRSA